MFHTRPHNIQVLLLFSQNCVYVVYMIKKLIKLKTTYLSLYSKAILNLVALTWSFLMAPVYASFVRAPCYYLPTGYATNLGKTSLQHANEQQPCWPSSPSHGFP